MHSHTIPRLLLVGFMFALIATGIVRYNAGAEQVALRDWTTTQSQENEFVQSCGAASIKTSYTTIRHYRRFDSPGGDEIVNHQDVKFSGAIGNVVTGKSYAYDGSYTRIADLEQGTNAVSNLLFRFEVGTPGMFSVSFKHVGFELADTPTAVIQTIVPHVLQRDLCSVLGGTTANNVSMPPTSIWINNALGKIAPVQPANVHTENSALEESEAISSLPEPSAMHTENSAPAQPAESSDQMTNWSELDPCDTSPPGQPC
jgi:hypothetical protein